ncbi:hypothetical protein GCM10023186_25930 [Hymenobacter koreensis]|uniref:Gingipain domain-containing protein n=2 Tax=Hymenobacter koreensis TaxID=1084523 RepID=A0ABP8J2Y1_9BACT
MGALCSLLAGSAAAQSGLYGNEWINYSQQYVKIPVLKDGIYRLDNQYLQQAGVPAGLNPGRLQLFRRGREVAIHVGGNTSSVDATTFVEFYGQRNDGQLDGEMYKDQSKRHNKLYSLYTDTAAYFLTWRTATTGNKRMAQPNLNLGNVATPTYHMATRTQLTVNAGVDTGDGGSPPPFETFFPWFEGGEGFLSTSFGWRTSGVTLGTFRIDSLRNYDRNGPLPQLEIMLNGAWYRDQHIVNTYAVQAGGTDRLLGRATLFGFNPLRVRYQLQHSDINADGTLNVKFVVEAPTTPGTLASLLRVSYFKVTYPQTNQWINGGHNFFQNDSTVTNVPSAFALSNAPAQTVGYDITDPYTVTRHPAQALTGGQQLLVFNTTALPTTRRYVAADVAQLLAPLPPRQVRFRNITASAHNFLIVTHGVLMRPAGAVTNPVRAYANYRASAAGGRHDTLVVTTPQLYDQFHYGEKSPIAIRHFALWMVANNTRQKYLLLLGKGLEPMTGGTYLPPGATQPVPVFHRKGGHLLAVKDLVPSSSRATSDIFFSARWDQGQYIPQMATGRIMAQTPQQVMDYLNKLQEHEAPGFQPWRKNLLHLSGGGDAAEQQAFLANVNGYKRIAERPCFSGNVVKTYSRTTVGQYDALPVNINIANELNAGLAMITFFGHGSNTTFDLNLGDPNDPGNNYNNRGKYPVMVYNGCAGGRSFVSAITTAEQWVLAPNRGAIGFLANSDFGYEAELDKYSTELYRTLFNEPQWYGKPIAVVQAEVSRRILAHFGSNNRNAIITSLCTTWQGDPAVKLESPTLPDLAVSSSNLSVAHTASSGATGPVLASTPRFALRVPVQQTGSSCYNDSVYVRLTRTVQGQAPQTVRYGFLSPVRDTVLTLEITNPSAAAVFGRNTFRVEVDPGNRIAELDENNNTAELVYTFLQGGVTILNPTEFGIVGRTDVRLVAQSNLPQAQARNYEFEIDTVATFNSPFLTAARRRTISAIDVAEWRPGLPTPVAGRDSVVYYWRVRYEPGSVQPDENGSWVTSSFRHINNSRGGWSQSHHGQFASNTLTDVRQLVPSGKWEFPEEVRNLVLRTTGGGAGTAATFVPGNQGIVSNNTPISTFCGQLLPNIYVAVFNPTTLQVTTNITGGPYQVCGSGNDAYFFFSAGNSGNDNINAAARQAQLAQLLQNVPAGHYVAVVSANRVNFSTASAALKAQLTALGSRVVNQLQDGDPFVLLAQKGNPATVKEATADPNASTPRNQQVVSVTENLRVRGVAGTITSTRIGPVQEWQTLYHTMRLPEASDGYRLRLVGYNATNQRTVLNPNVTSRSYSLANVSAQQYPYLALEVMVWDSVNRTAPQLKQWLVTYKGLPEGVVRRDRVTPANAYTPAVLNAQLNTTGVITFPVVFENVSAEDFPDRVTARATVQMADNSTVAPVNLVSTRALKADSTVTYNFSINLARVKGEGRIRIEVNPGLLPELHYFNNEVNLTFTAPSINLPPVVDVAFDGTRILNGDIVSPNPEIVVDVKYEDVRIPLDDPNKIELYLTRPGQTPERISMTGNSAVTFSVDRAAGRARVNFKPGTLPDGDYKLEAQATDMAGNTASQQRYAVDFKVINASSISNIYPYPNPIISKARFVFTLTGAELPRNMKIQIMSLTGKVVREIMQHELGPLRIGNNITEYAWDGTDEYGDRLANGTYLYRVLMDDPGKQFEHRRTTADWAFKKNWGKLVLLR